LSTYFMEETSAVINFDCGKMSLTDTGQCPKRIVIRLQGTQQSLSLRRVKRAQPPSQPKGGVAGRLAVLSQLPL